MAINSADKVVQNSRVNDPIQTAMNAIMNGQDAAEAVYGKGAIGFSDSPRSEDDNDDSSNILDTVQESGTGDDETQEATPAHNDTQEASESPSDETESPSLDRVNVQQSSPTGAIEEVFVKGADGKRKSLKIDYENKDSVKKAYLKASGFDVINGKLRDSSLKFQKLEKEHKEIKENWTKLESIFSEQGAKGVLLQLGGEKAIKELVDAELRHKEYLASLTPDEKYRLDVKQQEETTNKRFAEMEAKYKKREEEITARDERATLNSLESRFHPSFDRYRFAGKLGDPVAEHRLDKTVWNEVMSKLGEYPDNVELTQALIDKEFRTVASELQKVISVQTDKAVAKTVDKKKADATKVAQVTAKKGLSNGNEKERFVNSIKSGNIMDAMQSVMSGKIRL